MFVCLSVLMSVRLSANPFVSQSVRLFAYLFVCLSVFDTLHNNIQHKDIQHNDTQHKGLIFDTEHE